MREFRVNVVVDVAVTRGSIGPVEVSMWMTVVAKDETDAALWAGWIVYAFRTGLRETRTLSIEEVES